MSTLPPALSVSNIIEVNVSVASGGVAPRPFNQGLIVGTTPNIPSIGANSRLRQYPDTDSMLTDGFMDTDPEFLAAQIYFSQTPRPTFVWIGRQDLTAIFTAIPNGGNAGTGYVVGDMVLVVQSGGSTGYLKVLTVGGSGDVLTLGTVVGQQGTGYSTATGLSTTGGTGTGLKVDITAVGESAVEAVQACALINQEWYPFMVIGADDDDHLALAADSTANWETRLYFASTNDAGIPAGTADNLALQMKALKYKALLSYDTTQDAEFPNNIYAAAGWMGLACGLNTGAPNSAFTLNLKPVAGIAPEPMTQTQFDAIRDANCNTVASFGPYLGYTFNGVLESGDFYDQILDRAMLVNLIQTNLMNLLVSVPKVPQTDAGEQQLIQQVDQACALLVAMGFFAPGIWDGPQILSLKNGQALPQGYLNQAPPFSQQSAGDRAARKAMPISCAVIEAGAVHSVLVNVFTQL